MNSKMENTKNCTSCRHSYSLENFIGLKGQECKVCNICRQKVAERGKLASSKARKKELLVGTNKSAVYSKNYREKQKIENLENYIEQNKVKRVEWRKNWKEKNKNWRKTNVKVNSPSGELTHMYNRPAVLGQGQKDYEH